MQNRRWQGYTPNAATAVTLLLGLGAIEAARAASPDLGLALVLLAIISDGLDGVLARRLGATSRMGTHLDSLADLVVFGVAPGTIFGARHPDAPELVRMVVLTLVAGAGAWRLARFQAEPASGQFSGLPITAAGPLFAVATCGALPARWEDGLVWAALMALLMVSRVPYGRASANRMGRVAPIAALVFATVLALDAHTSFLLAQVALVVYVLNGLARGALGTVGSGLGGLAHQDARTDAGERAG